MTTTVPTSDDFNAAVTAIRADIAALTAKIATPTSVPAPVPTVGPIAPAPAVAAGYTKLAFNDDFTSLDLGDCKVGGAHKWFNDFPVWSSPPANWRSAYSQSGSVVTLTTSAAQGWWYPNLISTINGQGGFTYGYFEAVMWFDMPVGAWPAFWLEGAGHIAANTFPFSEIDVLEMQGNTPNTLYFTTHNWQSASNHPQTGAQPQAVVDWSKPHTLGCLHKPGSLTLYLDGVQMAQIPSYQIDDTDTHAIVLSAQANGWDSVGNRAAAGTTAMSVHVDRVSVFTA